MEILEGPTTRMRTTTVFFLISTTSSAEDDDDDVDDVVEDDNGDGDESGKKGCISFSCSFQGPCLAPLARGS